MPIVSISWVIKEIDELLRKQIQNWNSPRILESNQNFRNRWERVNYRVLAVLQNALGAMDGSHINSSPAATEQLICQNQKGFVSQNCLILLFILSIPSLNGKVLPQMHMSMKMPESRIYTFLLASTTLLMQVIHILSNSWYLFAMYDIILLKGVMHVPGEDLCFKDTI